MSQELLSNGAFDDDSAAWLINSSNDLPLLYRWDDPILATDGVTPDTLDFLALLGDASSEVSLLSQAVEIPAWATTLTATGYVLIRTEESSDQVYDRAFVELGSAAPNEFGAWTNQSEIDGWTLFEGTLDVSASAGTAVVFRLRATMDSSTSTRFYFDSLTLVAESCALP